MPARQIAGIPVEVSDEGFLTNSAQWSPEIAMALAEEEGIALQEDHWKVIAFVRKDAEQTGAPPTVRRITKAGGVATRELYALFPGGPAKKAAKIAGVVKPHGCI